jgi:hypothetical protein
MASTKALEHGQFGLFGVIMPERVAGQYQPSCTSCIQAKRGLP